MAWNQPNNGNDNRPTNGQRPPEIDLMLNYAFVRTSPHRKGFILLRVKT